MEFVEFAMVRAGVAVVAAKGGVSCSQAAPTGGSAPPRKWRTACPPTQSLGLSSAVWPYPFSVSSRASAGSRAMATPP